nr:MAG TPA: DNA-directed RNA polymerase [Caudoviricetes sp.]
MTDYIRREDALKALYNDYAYAAMDVIKRLPAADVAEVVYGRWILHHTVTGNPYTECSNCCTNVAVKTDKGTFAKLDMRGMPYCPFCSAKMDGGFDDATS